MILILHFKGELDLKCRLLSVIFACPPCNDSLDKEKVLSLMYTGPSSYLIYSLHSRKKKVLKGTPVPIIYTEIMYGNTVYD